MTVQTTRRALVAGAAAIPLTAPGLMTSTPGIASPANDEILSVIEDHRRAYADLTHALAASDIPGEPRETPRVLIGYDKGFELKIDQEGPRFTYEKKATGELVPVYASDEDEIKRLAETTDITNFSDLNELIATKVAELENERARINEAYSQTEKGKLEAKATEADNREYAIRCKLISTSPSTLHGVAYLLAYIRKTPDLSDQFNGGQVDRMLAATLEIAVCAAAGLPEPDIDEEVLNDLKESREYA